MTMPSAVQHVVTVIGARPQFIKAAPVSRAFVGAGLTERIVHTGQHYDTQMSDVFFTELGIPRPAHSLGIGSGPHGEQTAAMLAGIEQVLRADRPDMLVIYGDTNSTLAGALAAVKLHIPVAHIEAGLRSFNRRMPEEINRVLADHSSELLFAPTDAAVSHLAREGLTEGVHLVGDVMADATKMFAERAPAPDELARRFGVSPRHFVLATVHRAESTDREETLTAIVSAIEAVASQIPVVLPLHPRTAGCLREYGLEIGEQVTVTEPLGYLDMLALERDAAVVMTDSGGVQKEAFFNSVPCVTLRTETEWTELVDAGWNVLVDPNSTRPIVDAVIGSIGRRGKDVSPYGDGDAATRIASIVGHHESKWFRAP